jgi:hypothetical protein
MEINQSTAYGILSVIEYWLWTVKHWKISDLSWILSSFTIILINITGLL